MTTKLQRKHTLLNLFNNQMITYILRNPTRLKCLNNQMATKNKNKTTTKTPYSNVSTIKRLLKFQENLPSSIVLNKITTKMPRQPTIP